MLVSVILKLKQLDLCLQNELRNRLKAAFELVSKWWYVCKETVFYWCECVCVGGGGRLLKSGRFCLQFQC